MQELLENSDVVSIHIDGRPENKKFISRPEFEMMKQGVVFLNLSRGCVVDIEVIPEFIKSGKIKGVGLDVFPSEPKENGEFLSSLQNCPNVILTPHVGGSTYEAQQNIAEYVPQKLISYYFEGTTIKCVNLPEVMLPSRKGAQRIVHFHSNLPGVLSDLHKVVSALNVNIVGQVLGTRGQIGYAILDVETSVNHGILDRMRQVQRTINCRLL